ncbi:MAG: alpha-galactosidase [Candidatus Hydrogenedentota bacterium]
MLWTLIPALCVLSQVNDADVHLLENEHVEVRVSANEGRFSLLDKASGQVVVEGAVLDGGGGPCAPFQLDTPAFGAGNGLEITQSSGERCRITLFSGNRFVFIQRTIAASPETPIEYLNLVEAKLSFAPATSLKALGTAGLTAPGEHPGSYSFLAVAKPDTRAGIVAGWVTHNRGSGVVFSDTEDGEAVLRARVDYGDLKTGGDSEVLVLGYFDDARLGLEGYADLVANYYRIALPPIPSGYCTWYSNPHGGASDEQHIIELAEFTAENLKPFGFDFIQIDDRWQGPPRQSRELDLGDHTAKYLGKRDDLPLQQDHIWWWGPHADFTTHAPQGPYQGGMQPVAERLSQLGLTPGLWLMPFAWDPTAAPLRNHHDWFVKRSDGSLYYAYWSGWSLDMTHPEARDFLHDSVDRIANDWGYNYLKLDALFSGLAIEQLYVNDPYKEDDLGEAVFHDESATPVEAYRRGLRTVRDAAGSNTFILGCNVSQNMRTLGASFGLVDAMRIGPDNGSDWNGLRAGPWHGSNRYFFHGRVWYNDPDPVYVRKSMPIEHAQLICSWVALSGQLTVATDWLPGLPAERLAILKRILPNHGLRARPVDLFERELPAIWLLTDERTAPRRDVVGLFNWDEENPAVIACAVEKVGLPKAERYVGFDFWGNEFIEPFSDVLQLEVPAGSCRIIAVAPAPDHPRTISTSRHISQGIVDLRDEAWDADSKTLSGTSRVVGGDPYELRIVLPPVATWSVSRIETDAHNVATGFMQDGRHLRVTLDSPETAAVAWRITFETAR